MDIEAIEKWIKENPREAYPIFCKLMMGQGVGMMVGIGFSEEVIRQEFEETLKHSLNIKSMMQDAEADTPNPG